MSNQKDHRLTKNLDRCYKIVLQSSTKGMSAIEISKQLSMHKTTVHNYLNTLEYMGKVENEHGIWHVRTGEQTIKPLEKEIVIELPLPKKEWQRMTLLESMAKEWDMDVLRIAHEKLNETRTIRITGKDVDDLDLQKIANLIRQANEKSLKVNFKGLLKKLKRSRTNNSSAR